MKSPHLLQLQETIKATHSLYAPLKEMQKAMEFPHLHQIQEVIKATQSLYAPLEEMQKAIEFPKLHQLQEAIMATQSLYAPLKEMQRAMEFPHLHQLQELIKATQTLYAPLGEMQKAVEFPQLHQLQEAMKYSHLLQVQEAMKAVQLDSAIKAMLPQAWPLAYENFDTELFIDENNVIHADSTKYTQEEIQHLVNQITDRALLQETRFEQAVTTIVSEIAKLKNPTLEKILSWLIFPIIVAMVFSVINPIADFYIKEALSSNERQATKKIRKHVLGSIDSSVSLDSYRFVSTKNLELHAKPAERSPIIGRLHFGQALFLIERRGSWSLVAWNDDENQITIQGWVFSRYLSKFR